MRTRHIVLAALLAGLAARAQAACEGAVVLGGLHDAYYAMVTGSGGTRQMAAATLLVLAGDRASSRLAAQADLMGLGVPIDRLDGVLSGARELAAAVLTTPDHRIDRLAHASNIEWLGTLYEQTGCRNSLAHASLPVGAASAQSTVNGETSGRVRKSGDTDVIRLIILTVASGAGVAGLVLAVRFVRQTLFFRRHQAERQPRTAISLEIEVGFEDESGTSQRKRLTALDVSAGGMKLAWNDPPGQGTALSLSLPVGERGATVIWSNAFYVGVMFDELLEEETLQTLIEAA